MKNLMFLFSLILLVAHVASAQDRLSQSIGTIPANSALTFGVPLSVIASQTTMSLNNDGTASNPGSSCSLQFTSSSVDRTIPAGMTFTVTTTQLTSVGEMVNLVHTQDNSSLSILCGSTKTISDLQSALQNFGAQLALSNPSTY